MGNIEIEAKFLEIDKEDIKKKLKSLGAIDLGEDLVEEAILYDRDLKWRDESKEFIRLRKINGKVFVTYKKRLSNELGGTEEVEFETSDFEKTAIVFEKAGFPIYRRQEKRRHTFKLNNVTFDIDTWPKIPTYIEIEGGSGDEIKKAAEGLGFDWKDAHFENARIIIEKIYSVPVGKMRWFTFGRIE